MGVLIQALRRLASIQSAGAYRRWRGKRPVSGYGRDLIAWDYEDEKMRACWDAAVKWATSGRG